MTVSIISWTEGGGSHILRSTAYIVKVQEQSKDWSHRRSPKRSWFAPWEARKRASPKIPRLTTDDQIKTHHRWSDRLTIDDQDSPQMIRSRLTIDDQDSPQMIRSTHHRRSRLTTDDQDSPQTIRSTHHRRSKFKARRQIIQSNLTSIPCVCFLVCTLRLWFRSVWKTSSLDHAAQRANLFFFFFFFWLTGGNYSQFYQRK